MVRGSVIGRVIRESGDVDVHETLKESGRGTSSRQWLRNSLVVGEVATTLVLLIAAGLMIRSFYLLQKVNPGFSHEHLTSFSVSLPQKKYESQESKASFYDRLLENIRALPGVQRVGAIQHLPLSGIRPEDLHDAAQIVAPQGGHDPLGKILLRRRRGRRRRVECRQPDDRTGIHKL